MTRTDVSEKVELALAKQRLRVETARRRLAYAEADLAQLEGIQKSLETLGQRGA